MPRKRQIRLEGPARVVVETGGLRVTADVSNETAQAILRLIAAPEPATGDDPAFADYVAGEIAAAEETHGRTSSISGASGALPPDHRR